MTLNPGAYTAIVTGMSSTATPDTFDEVLITSVQPLDELVIAYRDDLTANGSAFRYVQASIRQIRAFTG